MALIVEGFAGGDFGAPGRAEVVFGGIEDCNEDLDDALCFGRWSPRMLLLLLSG